MAIIFATVFIIFSYSFCKLVFRWIEETLNSHKYINPGKLIFIKHINAIQERNANYLIRSFHSMEKFYCIAFYLITWLKWHIHLLLRIYTIEYGVYHKSTLQVCWFSVYRKITTLIWKWTRDIMYFLFS